MLEDAVDSEPVLRYITDLATREELFFEFQNLARQYYVAGGLNGIALGIIMVAPLKQLRSCLDMVKNDADQTRARATAKSIVNDLCSATAINGIRACKFQKTDHTCFLFSLLSI